MRVTRLRGGVASRVSYEARSQSLSVGSRSFRRGNPTS